ncbi:MAG: hypothetical protein WC593_08895 [Methanoregula sp.]
MIPEKEEQDRTEFFFQIMLIGELFTSSLRNDQNNFFRENLRKYGVILNQSDLMILDNSRIGNSTITIASYTLDYSHNREAPGKRICVEGTVALETDEFGNKHIRISSKTDLFRHNYDSTHSESSPDQKKKMIWSDSLSTNVKNV